MSMTFEQLQIIAEQALILSERNTQSISRLEDSLTRLEDSISRLESSLVETKAIADSNARAIQATANKLDEKFNQIADAVIRGQDRLERLERRDRRVDKELRGLRIETRRILERWLGEPFPDDPDLEDDELE